MLSIKKILFDLKQYSVKVSLVWVKGYCGIAENESVNRAAKKK